MAMERHIAFRDRPQSDFLEFVEMAADAINQALRNVPSERMQMHVCWGNYEGPHDQDVPFADVATIVRRANLGGFVLPCPSQMDAMLTSTVYLKKRHWKMNRFSWLGSSIP